jgi:heme exporter protein CcmD
VSHAFYLWASYAMAAAVIAVEVVSLFMRRSRALRRVEEERSLEAQD